MMSNTHELVCDNLGCLLPPLIDAFMVEHILNHLLCGIFIK
jgi:hypothetical protein